MLPAEGYGVPLTPKSPWSPPLPKWELAIGCRAKSCRECEGVPQMIISTAASLPRCPAETRRSHAARRASPTGRCLSRASLAAPVPPMWRMPARAVGTAHPTMLCLSKRVWNPPLGKS